MILSILAINNNDIKHEYSKVLIAYLSITCFTILTNQIYSLYGHGVSSDAMTFMFLYPLLGGFIFFLIIRLFFSKIYYFSGYRVFFNIHNSGIATLTIGSFLRGIFEIAGTASNYVKYYYIFGWIFIGISLLLFLGMLLNKNKKTLEE